MGVIVSVEVAVSVGFGVREIVIDGVMVIVGESEGVAVGTSVSVGARVESGASVAAGAAWQPAPSTARMASNKKAMKKRS
jgi:hypothetical protein